MRLNHGLKENKSEGMSNWLIKKIQNGMGKDRLQQIFLFYFKTENRNRKVF